MKKVLAILLVLAMLIPMAACGNKTPTPEQPAAPTEPTAPAEPTTPADPSSTAEPSTPEPEPEKQWLPFVQPGENNKLSIGIVTKTNVTDYDDNYFTKWIEETTGIDLEFQIFAGTGSDCARQLALMIAANEKLPDLLWYWTGISFSTANEYGEEEYFLDLTEFLNDPDMNHFRDTALKEQFFDDADATLQQMLNSIKNASTGASYVYPTVSKAALDGVCFPTYINKEWLDKLKLQVPTTVDELYNVLKHFRDDDPNGNGKKDEIPMIGWAGHNNYDAVEYIINAYIYLCDLYYFNVNNGKISIPYNTDAYREALKFVRKLVDEGLLSQMTWSIGANSELVSLLNPADGVPTIGVCCGHPTVIWANEDGSGLLDANKNYKWVALPMLKDASGKGLGGYAPFKETTVTKAHFITADAENPALAYKLLDYLMSTESMLRMRYGRPDIDWRYPTEAEMYNDAGQKALFINLDASSFTANNNLHWHVATGTMNSCDFFIGGSIAGQDPTFLDYRTGLSNSIRKYYADTGLPKEVCYSLTYTTDETSERSDFTGDLTSYISKSRTAFCTGELDPNNDKDWNDYLSNLKNLKVDRWIEIAQAAYDRAK